MKVLCACEESQAVCKAFRSRGHVAFSCDIRPCSGGFPEWHIQDDVFHVLYSDWDLVIAFPPCTYLTFAGNAWFSKKVVNADQIYLRELSRVSAAKFFLAFTRLSVPWAIENPNGVMSRIYRPPDQIIQPYQFGESYSKRTCLWLHDLPPLCPTCHILDYHSSKGGSTSFGYNGYTRSKTFPGIAEAMASQWG